MPTVFVPKETHAGETRVAATPETARKLVASGLDVVVGRGAGAASGHPDERYTEIGAKLAGDEAWGTADVVLKVRAPSPDEARKAREGAILVALIVPSACPEVVRLLAERGITCFAMDLVPRITRAQSMDALSSQATVAGYKAVLVGASQLARMCPLLMTAAGTVTPARVVVFGAGVAGLQAIATAKRLGCQVEATDIRLAAREQVLSLGARFIDVPGAEDMEGAGGYAKEATPEFLARQREEVAKRVAEADLVITTAQVPGRKAPMLVSADMVRTMKKGAVLVDLAVESGGNCELSVSGEIAEREGVVVVGIENLPATVPGTASDLYAKNVLNLVKLFVGKDGAIASDHDDEVLTGCLLTHRGEVRHERTAQELAQEAPAT
jgi:NAD(P) transhydrogenase subunit alpha